MRLALLTVGGQRPAQPAVLKGLYPEWAHSAVDAAGVDAALAELDADRLVIDARDLGALNLVLSRLMRRGRLADLQTAVLLAGPLGYLGRLGLPAELDAQLEIARRGSARLVGVLKDDSGGLCADGATLSPWQDGDWWVRAVVDDQRLIDGNARSLSVRRLGPAELEASVRLGRLRGRGRRGRSVQLACDPAQIVADGMGRQRPRSKRTFWAEPDLWQLALP